jgi:hypothetical protein
MWNLNNDQFPDDFKYKELTITKFQRYYCTLIDYIISFSIVFIIANFVNIFIKDSLEEFYSVFALFIITLSLMQFYNINAIGLIFKHEIVNDNNSKLHFISVVIRNIIKLLIVGLFIFTTPLSLIVYPFHTTMYNRENTVIDQILLTRAVKVENM